VLNPQVTQYMPISEIPMDTVKLSTVFQHNQLVLPVTSQNCSSLLSTFMQPKRVELSKKAVLANNRTHIFLLNSRGNMATSQAVNCLPLNPF